MRFLRGTVEFVQGGESHMPSGSRSGDIEIRLVTDDLPSRATRDQLQRLLKVHDISKWIFTRIVAIDRTAIPHSHPVLTLHTRHLNGDDQLLSTFLHEQIHWFLSSIYETHVLPALEDLYLHFPGLPIGFPEGAADEHSTYLHLIINYLEYLALAEVVGSVRADKVFAFWSTDHYCAIYSAVRQRGEEIEKILLAHRVLAAFPART